MAAQPPALLLLVKVGPLYDVGAIRKSLEEANLSRGQILAIILTALVAGLDGYDVQSIALVAPAISHAWAIPKHTLGLVLASSLVGMAGGSLGLSPFADVLGRRPMVQVALVLLTLGSLCSGLSHAVWQLAASRVVTGLGIGVMVSLTTVLAAEFVNARRRGLAVAAVTTGLPIGGVIAGLVAASFLKSQGWTWVFYGGAILGAVLLALVTVGLPESPVFLMDRVPSNALERLNRVLRRLGRDPVAALPPPAKPSAARTSYRALFTRETAPTTIRFVVVYLLNVTATYFLLSWLPQMIADAGFHPSTASLVTAVSSLVSLPAGFVFGAFAARIGPTRLASLAMVGFAAGVAAFGLVPGVLPALLGAACVCSFFLSGATAVFYASMAASFPPLSRVSGLGLVTGIGRLFSGLGPYTAGLMFSAGLARSGVCLVFAGLAALGGLLLMTGQRRLLPRQNQMGA